MRKKNLLRILFAFFLAFLHPYHLSSQSPVTPLGQLPTPQATDLGRFGDIPISYYTGRANVVVPIQSFTERGVTLDINLSYDTSGLLMNKLPGWVGPGWTLNAGGCITRVQRNQPDERIDLFNTGSTFTNYFRTYSDLIDNNGNFNAAFVLNFDNYAYRDYAPDLFYFSFLGKTGCFFLGNDGLWKVSSDENLVVEFDINNSTNYQSPLFNHYPQGTGFPQPKAIKGFALYDDNGNKYIFGGDTLSVEYSIDLYHTNEQQYVYPWIATSWFLTKVEDRFGNTLYEFTYERGKYLIQMFPPQSSGTSSFSATLNLPVYLTRITTLQGNVISFYMEHPYNSGEAARNLYPSLYHNGNAVDFFYPSMVVNPLPFYYLQKNIDQHARYYSATGMLDPNDPLSAMDIERLQEIRIRSGQSTASVCYEFDYNETGRYHLSSISTKAGYTIQGSYSFIYNDYASVPSDYLTNKHDSWGYFNDILGSRFPNLIACEKGMLTGIIYPTGGKSVFDYELNDFGSRMDIHRTDTVMESGTAFGLRIASITEYDANQSLLKKRSFDYTNPSTGLSSGQYFADPDDDSYYLIAWGRSLDNGNTVPVIPLFTSLKTIVGYSIVTETVEGVGSHIYCYSNFANVGYSPSAGIQPNANEGLLGFPDAFSRQDFLRGKLVAEYIMDEMGNLKMDRQYEHRTDAAIYMKQRVYGFDPNYYDSSTGNGGRITLYYPKYDLRRMATSMEYGDDVVKDTVTYAMTDFNSSIGSLQPPYFRKCTMERTSRQGMRIQKDYDYVSLAENKYFIPLVSTTTRYNENIIQTDAIDYAFFNGKYHPEYEVCTIGNGSPDTLVTYNSYSSTGLPLAYTRKGEFPTRLFWHNTYKDKIVGIITEPMNHIQNISINTTVQEPVNVLKYNNQSIFNYPNVKATTFVYNTKGQVAATATDNGITSYYDYDAMGRLEEIRDGTNKVLQRFTYHYSTGN